MSEERRSGNSGGNATSHDLSRVIQINVRRSHISPPLPPSMVQILTQELPVGPAGPFDISAARASLDPQLAGIFAMDLLDRLPRRIYDRAESYERDEDLERFAAWVDFAQGLQSVLLAVATAAQIHLAGGVSDDLIRRNVRLFSQIQAEFVPKETTPEELETAEEFELQMVNQHRQLFADDQSGFALADEVVAQIERIASGSATEDERKLFDPYRSPEYVLAGAKFAQQAYESLYSAYLDSRQASS